MSQLRSIVDRTYAAFNARDFEVYPELLDERVELIMSGVAVSGLAAVTDFVSVTARARPSLQIEPVRVFAESDDTLVAEVRMVDAAAPNAPAASAGSQAAGCGLYRAAGGRIVEWRVYMDPAGADLASAALVPVAAEQSALRRVAELVARHAPSAEVFALVTKEVGHLVGGSLMVRTVRFESDGSATILAADGMPDDLIPAGTNTPRPGGGILDQVFCTGRPGRVDEYRQVTGPLSASLLAAGIRSAAAGPIVVDGRTWGAIAVASDQRLPDGTEERVAEFAELVSTAVSNLETRAHVERLAAEQSALRRVATLVAREYAPDDVFAVLAEEVGVLLEVDVSAILRYEGDGTATTVARWSKEPVAIELGERLALDGENLASEVLRTGLPQRKDDYAGAPGQIAAHVRAIGVHSSVASPVVVEGVPWGVIGVLSRTPQLLPPDTEERIAEFSGHAAMAVANAKNRSDLALSRARIVRAGDDARRRLERDLHDGAQQRLVSLGLGLRTAQESLPPELPEVRRALAALGAGLADVLDDLRELSRGLHPAVLSEGGLAPALRALARRSAVPVALTLELPEERCEEPVEVAAYYVVSEALTNTAKHSGASCVQVTARLDEGALQLVVRDDGRGGADAARGSGLIGLVDRVEAIGGAIRVESPHGTGTSILVTLPAGAR